MAGNTVMTLPSLSSLLTNPRTEHPIDVSKPKKASSPEPVSKQRLFSYQNRILLLALFVALPALSVAGALLWSSDHSLQTKWTISGVLVVVSIAASFILQN